MSISKKLWESHSDLAYRCLKTKFVQGVKTGDLPRKQFQEYIAQDYFFLESFARAYGLAVSKAKDKKNIKIVSELLSGVSDELILHETYSKQWDINLKTNSIKPATKKYTDFLKEVSINSTFIEIMSAMSPCMRLYSWLGKKLVNTNLSNPYRDWILTYSDESFDKLAIKVENIIDECSDSYNIDQVNFLYKKAMELELEFFNAYSSFSLN